jgi:hypothetical protein
MIQKIKSRLVSTREGRKPPEESLPGPVIESKKGYKLIWLDETRVLFRSDESPEKDVVILTVPEKLLLVNAR